MIKLNDSSIVKWLFRKGHKEHDSIGDLVIISVNLMEYKLD